MSSSAKLQTVFLEVFEPLPRQGPGRESCTRRALALCNGLLTAPRILDLGCGNGAQTLDLARATGGRIVAIDSHPPNIERLRERLQSSGLSEQVEARVGDMTDLDPDPASFDLVWSEGALYNVGLRTGLNIAKRSLRPGGLLAFTEPVWRTDEALPTEVEALFAEYPAMGTEADVLSLLERRGWTVLGHFVLPEEAWWDDYYGPMERRIEELRGRYAGDAEALVALEEIAKEPDLHRRHGDLYGYAFFVAQA